MELGSTKLLWKSFILRWCSICCLVAGTLALSTYGYFWVSAHSYQAFESWRFNMNRRELMTPRRPSEARFVEAVSSAALSSTALGRIEIPRIGISVMILEGVDDHTLRIAAGHVPDTALPGYGGNVAIAAHRDTFFRPLENIRPKDEIMLETSAGTFQYQVEATWIVAPYQVEVLDPTPKPALTLITCYPFHFVGAAPYRFIVRAREIAFTRRAVFPSERFGEHAF